MHVSCQSAVLLFLIDFEMLLPELYFTVITKIHTYRDRKTNFSFLIGNFLVIVTFLFLKNLTLLFIRVYESKFPQSSARISLQYLMLFN